MALNPEIKKIITEYYQSGFPAYSSLTPSELRREFNARFKAKKKLSSISLAKIESINIAVSNHTIKLRIYYPSFAQNMPALMYFHGGGFVIRDDMDIYDGTCRLIAQQMGCVVIAVDFRLAPEHPFPAAIEDCYDATYWVAAHSHQLSIDKNYLGVWGESCGGNLSTITATLARDRQGPNLKCQIIISPMLDINFNRISYLQYAEGYILTRDTMQWFWRHYLVNETDKINSYAIPVLTKDLSNLPPALVVTTECDVLKDEGEFYSQQLKQAAVNTIYCSYPSLIHGFFDLYNKAEIAKTACQDIFQKAKILMKK